MCCCDWFLKLLAILISLFSAFLSMWFHSQPAAVIIASGTGFCRASANAFTLGSQFFSSSQMSAGISCRCDPHFSSHSSCHHPCSPGCRCLSDISGCFLFLHICVGHSTAHPLNPCIQQHVRSSSDHPCSVLGLLGFFFKDYVFPLSADRVAAASDSWNCPDMTKNNSGNKMG